MNMVFSQTTVLELKLPEQAAAQAVAAAKKNENIEIILRPNMVQVNYPERVPIKQIGRLDETGLIDFRGLSEFLWSLKSTIEETLNEDTPEGDIWKTKKDITLLVDKATDYQTLVSSMDAIRVYQKEIILSVKLEELFPDISLGDAPPSQDVSPSSGGDV